MKTFARAVRRQWLEALLAAALGALCLQLYLARRPIEAPRSEMALHAENSGADMSLRHANFPATFISAIHVELTSPDQFVRVTWSGPDAAAQPTGPFHSSPGRGLGTNDCNDFAESCRGGSHCTPKGKWHVEAFSPFMESGREYRFVTWFNSSREIAIHSHPEIPDHPASSGCVRVSEYAAQLIHNNSIVGRTEVVVEGVWTQPPTETTNQPSSAEGISESNLRAVI